MSNAKGKYVHKKVYISLYLPCFIVNNCRSKSSMPTRLLMKPHSKPYLEPTSTER